jgi:hypothetical protein
VYSNSRSVEVMYVETSMDTCTQRWNNAVSCNPKDSARPREMGETDSRKHTARMAMANKMSDVAISNLAVTQLIQHHRWKNILLLRSILNRWAVSNRMVSPYARIVSRPVSVSERELNIGDLGT